LLGFRGGTQRHNLEWYLRPRIGRSRTASRFVPLLRQACLTFAAARWAASQSAHSGSRPDALGVSNCFLFVLTTAPATSGGRHHGISLAIHLDAARSLVGSGLYGRAEHGTCKSRWGGPSQPLDEGSRAELIRLQPEGATERALVTWLLYDPQDHRLSLRRSASQQPAPTHTFPVAGR
jgi:hypothetical protein